MSIIIVDVEADGPCPGLYSMVSFGAVSIKDDLKSTFYGETAPITDIWVPEALAISGVTREQHLTFSRPEPVMWDFSAWINSNYSGRPIFVSDNPAFDWQFINYYFHKYIGFNPFGHSARRIGDFYSGLKQDWYAANNWRHLCKTKHTHHPVDDATGAAEGLVAMAKKFNITLPRGELK